ncbi:MAG: NUDIX domain-containing protein [Patescibacteria group bacterium]
MTINKDEILFVVDENNHPIEPLKREIVHKKGYWHRTAHVWIVNGKQEILCQQRSLQKDSSPGKWEPFFGGHLGPHDGYAETATQELREELGLRISRSDLKQYGVFKAPHAHEFIGLFVLQWECNIENIAFEKEEIDQLRLIDREELEQIILWDKKPEWNRIGYEEELFSYIKGLK